MREIEITRQGDVYVATWPVHPSAAGVHAYFDELDGILAQKRPFALVLDALQTKSASSQVRQIAGDRLKQQKAERLVNLKGEATVLDSTLIRGALAAVYFLAPPGYPTKVFGSVPSARDWAHSQLHGSRELRQ